jgi:hypothetical protein
VAIRESSDSAVGKEIRAGLMDVLSHQAQSCIALRSESAFLRNNGKACLILFASCK